MAVCEKCGTTFEPKQTGQVTTLRILCEPCAEARALEKAQRAGRSPAAPAAPAAAPKTVPTAPAAPAAAPKAAPAAVPARIPSAPKVAPQAKASVPAKVAERAKEPPRKPEPESELESDPELEAEPVSKGSAAKRRPARKAEKPSAAPRKRGFSTAVLGWMVAGGALLACGGALYVILGKKHADEKVVEDYVAKITGIYEHIKELSADGSEKSAQELLTYAAANEETWKTCDFAADITALVAKSKNQLEKLRRTREVENAMAVVEAGLGSVESATPEAIAELMRGLADVEPRAESQGADFVGRVGRARTVLDRAYSGALIRVAKSFADENPDKGRQALQHYTKAEDEVIRLLDASLKSKNKDAETYFRDQYKELITASDALVQATFPPEEIEKLPWKDLLSGEQTGYWNPASVKGFSHHIDAGTLTLIGPDPDAKGLGMISIGDREQWRDFTFDMQFTLESGSFDLYFRIGQNTGPSVPRVTFAVGQDGGLVGGKTYEIAGKMVASDLEVTVYPEDMQTQTLQLLWTEMRKGGLGFALTEGTRLKITRMRVRELRISGE